jgi:hypothetical protein
METTAHEVVHYIVRWSDAAKDLAYESLFLFTRNFSETCEWEIQVRKMQWQGEIRARMWI